MTDTIPTTTPTTTTVLEPGQLADRFAESFRMLSSMDLATAIEQAGADAECVSPDYAPDDADVAVESADPRVVAEVNALLLYLAEQGPPMAFALQMLYRLTGRVEGVIGDVFGDIDEAVWDGLRINQRIRAAYALADQVRDAHPDCQ